MRVKINEIEQILPPAVSLWQVKERFKPNADLVIYNGFPVEDDIPLREGDEVVLVRRGEVPSADELESLMMARHTPGVHRKLKEGKVGIAGLGGLGSAVAIALARVGVGTLVLADFDVVEPSNLNRQQYFIDQIGLPKGEAMRTNLQRINPHSKLIVHNVILSPDNIPHVFDGVDIIVEAFDRADTKAMLINTVCEQMRDKYIVAASGLAGYGNGNEIRTAGFSSKIFIVGDQRTAAQPGTGLMSPRVGIAAHHQANLVVRILLGEEG